MGPPYKLSFPNIYKNPSVMNHFLVVLSCRTSNHQSIVLAQNFKYIQGRVITKFPRPNFMTFPRLLATKKETL